MGRRNPHVGGGQPDLFAEGETKQFVPLESLSKEQIRALPRSAFDEMEWDDLDEDDQEYIYEHDEESKKRRALMKSVLESHAHHLVDEEAGKEEALIREEEFLGYDPDELVVAFLDSSDGDELVEEFSPLWDPVRMRITRAQFDEALGEALMEYDNYKVELVGHDPHHRPTCTRYWPVASDIYINWEYYLDDNDYLPLNEITEDEIKYTIRDELEPDYNDFYYYSASDIYESMQEPKWPSYEWQGDPTWALCADAILRRVRNSIIWSLDLEDVMDEEPDPESEITEPEPCPECGTDRKILEDKSLPRPMYSCPGCGGMWGAEVIDPETDEKLWIAEG